MRQLDLAAIEQWELVDSVDENLVCYGTNWSNFDFSSSCMNGDIEDDAD
ncbi:hypothetical protein VCHA53P481_30165 [Vibrio chagasii]|nr:hypothetical protein VCHA32O87_20165 [Vibrio chagasii]CAH7282853.1 hypothetical protein VCHA53P481_30165 [Vibrio chagasii]